jgi:hypothetical protein
MAGGISGLVDNAMGLNITPAISESYLNDKKELTNYYIGQYARFAGIIQIFMLTITIVVLSVLEPAYMDLGLENYIMTIPFIIPQIIRKIQQPYTSLADTIMIGTNHPTVLMIIRFCEEVIKVISITLFLVILRLPDKFGINAIIWIMPCGIYPAILFKTIFLYVYINRKIMHLKIPFWQAHIAPIFACAVTYIIMEVFRVSVLMPMWKLYGLIPALIAILAMLMVVLMIVFFPLTGLLGAWDDASLRDFKKASRMSGPSKFLVVPMYKGAEWGCRVSPIGNRFGVDATIPMREAEELLVIKRSHYAQAQKELN